MREINEAGLALIKKFEGIQIKAYPCPAGVWTIGYGHTKTAHEGMIITKERAEQLLKDDLAVFCAGVSKMVTVPINDNQFAALVSFAFNCGLGNLQRSTLLKKLNAGLYRKAADEFLRWNRANGHILSGLSIRRKAEMELFES